MAGSLNVNDLIIFEALAESVGLSEVLSKRPWHHFFAMDQRIEAVCRLLMEETEDQCARGGVYFESPGFGIKRTSTAFSALLRHNAFGISIPS